LFRVFNHAQDFFVRNFFRNNHRDVPSDHWISIELPKLLRHFVGNQKKISVHFCNEYRTRRARFGRRKLSAETNHSIAGVNIDWQRETWKSSGSKRQARDNAFEPAFQIEEIEAAICLRSPIRR